MSSIYYRPRWTCGRYNSANNVALIYNLIEGVSYYFEDYSALVIGVILSINRDKYITLEDLSKETDIDTNSLELFLNELVDLGLVTTELYTSTKILAYRKRISIHRCSQYDESPNVLQEIIDSNGSNAEMVYADKIGGITSVMLELTYKCSESCLHCYNPGATRNNVEINLRGDREELILDDYKRVIDELCEQGLFKVCLSGGDPFSKRIIWEVIDYLYEKELAFDIFTNGIGAIGNVDRLANYYPRLIGVSLYSNIPTVHDEITRTVGSYQKTISFIRLCAEQGIPLNLKCCIMLLNINSYYTVKDVAKKYGAIPQFDLNITDSVEGDKCASHNLRLTSELMEIVLRDKDLPYYVDSSGVIKEKGRNLSEKVCGAGITSFCITPEGNIQPCCAFPFRIGNVKDESIYDILSKSVGWHWWQQQKNENFVECYKHDYCVYCQMCPGNNYIAHGTPLKPSDNNCFLAITRYKLARKMENGYDPLCGKSLKERLQEVEVHIPNLQREESVNYRNFNRVNEVS
ncbi:radical SAM protein [Bacteroides zhangwenhongii]|jgi:hypothetical protein|uniref:radical SAM protein n=1 Tax=Bacteroides zhangwenhongii TaxID=2650157 RepID=UPI0032BF6D8A